VEQNASQDDIRKMYRKLCLKYHPDKNIHLNGDEQIRCENKFKAVQEANSLIGTSEARRQYEQQNQATKIFNRNSNNRNNMGNENIFNSWFDEQHAGAATDNPYYTSNGGNRGHSRYQFPQRRRFYVNGIDISHLFNPHQSQGFSTSRTSNPFHQNPTTMNNEDDSMPKSIFVQKVTVSLEELYSGVNRKEFQCNDDIFQRYRAAFRGGIASQIALQGVMTSAPLLFRTSWPVSLLVFLLTCHVSLPRPSRLFYFTKIKRGWKSGTKLRFNYEPGVDVVFILDEGKHDRFIRVGNDLKTTASIGLSKARNGCTIVIDPLGGDEMPIMVKLKKRTVENVGDTHVMAVKGRGWPKSDGSRGDLFVTVKVISDRSAKKQKSKKKGVNARRG